MFLLVPEVLHGLGLLPAVAPAEFGAVRPDGSSVTERLDPIDAEDYRSWLMRSAIMLPPAGSPPPRYLLGPDEPLTLFWDQETGTAYLRYREVRAASAVVRQFAELVATGDVRRVVVDLRWNPGGNNLTYPPLVAALLDPAVNQPGLLYVLISRITFSAAANFATELDQRSAAVFVGEATGGSPNLYGDTINHRMEWFGLTVRIPTLYWQKSVADDPRLSIEPDLEVPLTASDYFSGADPVLAAVLV
jgi:C-terminal processing protease CtpA/Prc